MAERLWEYCVRGSVLSGYGNVKAHLDMAKRAWIWESVAGYGKARLWEYCVRGLVLSGYVKARLDMAKRVWIWQSAPGYGKARLDMAKRVYGNTAFAFRPIWIWKSAPGYGKARLRMSFHAKCLLKGQLS